MASQLKDFSPFPVLVTAAAPEGAVYLHPQALQEPTGSSKAAVASVLGTVGPRARTSNKLMLTHPARAGRENLQK